MPSKKKQKWVEEAKRRWEKEYEADKRMMHLLKRKQPQPKRANPASLNEHIIGGRKLLSQKRLYAMELPLASAKYVKHMESLPEQRPEKTGYTKKATMEVAARALADQNKHTTTDRKQVAKSLVNEHDKLISEIEGGVKNYSLGYDGRIRDLKRASHFLDTGKYVPYRSLNASQQIMKNQRDQTRALVKALPKYRKLPRAYQLHPNLRSQHMYLLPPYRAVGRHPTLKRGVLGKEPKPVPQVLPEVKDFLSGFAVRPYAQQGFLGQK